MKKNVLSFVFLHWLSIGITFAQSVLPAPVLSFPRNGAITGRDLEHPYLIFEWTKVDSALAYEFQISKSEDNFTALHDQKIITNITVPIGFNKLQPPTSYKWRVRALNGNQVSVWSEVFEVSIEIGTPNENEILNISEPRLSLYPNPSKGTVFLEWIANITDRCSIDVYNVNGQKLTSFKDMPLSIGKNTFPIDLTSFNNGYYILTMKNSKGTFSVPFIIQK